LLDAWRAGQFSSAEIVLVVSDHEQAPALDRARTVNVPAEFVDPQRYSSPTAFDQELRKLLEKHDVNVICLAGYLRILTPETVKAFPNRILNIHPALLPAFGGRACMACACIARSWNPEPNFPAVRSISWMRARTPGLSSCRPWSRSWTRTRRKAW